MVKRMNQEDKLGNGRIENSHRTGTLSNLQGTETLIPDTVIKLTPEQLED